MPLDILLEGLLFYKGTPLKKSAICTQFSVDSEGLSAATTALATRLQTGALRLVETETEIMLATSPDLAPFIEDLKKQDIKRDISKAGAETLAIILYRGTVSKADIDHIRGVNSSFILRNLLMRGLIERSSAKKGGGYTFSITTELLAHLGVTAASDLVDFARVTDALETFLATDTSDTEVTPESI